MERREAVHVFRNGALGMQLMEDAVGAFSRAYAANEEIAEVILASAPPLIELLPVAIYACDASGRVCWYNRLAAEIWGRAPTIGDNPDRFCGSHKIFSLDGTLIRREQAPMAHVLRTGEAISGQQAIIERPDGTRIIAMVHIDPIKDAGGNVIGAINCFHDVTELRKEDRRARDSEREFRELLDALPAAIYTTDPAGRITYYNDAAVELAGRRPQLGSDEWCVTWRLYWPDGTPLPHDQCPMAVALKEDRAVRGAEAVAERPDGTRVPFIPYPTPLHDAQGRLIGAVNMLVDISQRKDAETQQRVLFSELNHRIKNNMQMLHALLSAARRESRSEEARNVLGEAIRRVGAMAVAQTVLYQANNAGGYQAQEFIGAICRSAREAFGGALEIHCEAAHGELSNDTASPLALILNELITNAAKYGTDGDGHGTVRISLNREGRNFTLRVEDDGSGFDLAETQRRGSGLGLVTGLARQIGGTFSVERTPGACCVVSFVDQTLPL
jgi:PAS domain S-box-containing protein